jgi:hypothetical protein
MWDADEVRDDIFNKTENFYDRPKAKAVLDFVARLEEASLALGLEHIVHTGKSPVLKYGFTSPRAEVWAIYSEKRERKGPKLTFIPRWTDHSPTLRAAVTRLALNHSGDWEGRKLDLTLATLTEFVHWAPVQAALESAIAHYKPGP